MPAERQVTEGDADTSGEGASLPERVAPSDAFQALGGETRIAILRALGTAEPCSFSKLFETTDEDTSAGFAYHLRQVTGRFVRQREDECYELTDAGRRILRAVRAGTFTASVDRDPVELDEACPFCGAQALVATVSDNVAAVDCRACDSQLLSTSVPPGGHADRPGDRLPAAVDSRYRRRIDSFADGVCPECAGPVEGTVEPAGEARTESVPEEHQPVQAAYACDTCGARLRCPVTLTVLTHPAVVAFYHDHGEDIRERPVWNVGAEWAECLLSRDPWCVVVRSRLDDEVLSLYVARDGRVVDTRRRVLPADEHRSATGDEGGPDDDPDGGSRPRPSTDRSEEPEADTDKEAPTADDPEVTDPSASADGATA